MPNSALLIHTNDLGLTTFDPPYFIALAANVLTRADAKGVQAGLAPHSTCLPPNQQAHFFEDSGFCA